MADTTTTNYKVSVIDEGEEQLEALASDLWIGIALILLILSSIGCLCSCLMYHKFRQWKRHDLRLPSGSDSSCQRRQSVESLPSYTLVTGLPTYEQAMSQQVIISCSPTKS
ncbi:unnamed protein product [Nezara viridula]|uniref:Uncharacterized protein n=1 Tax=Nezara viridula TaxID=85310 RepID=A0A9P0GWU4_NEZVI|nr:unnamed protein product [Nezara viridula]